MRAASFSRSRRSRAPAPAAMRTECCGNTLGEDFGGGRRTTYSGRFRSRPARQNALRDHGTTLRLNHLASLVTASVKPRRTISRRRYDRLLSPTMSLVMLTTVFAGFAPNYFLAGMARAASGQPPFLTSTAIVGMKQAQELSSVESEAMSLSASCIDPSIDCTRSVTSLPIETDVPFNDPIARALRLCFRNST